MEKKTERVEGKDGAATSVEKTVSTLKHNHGDCTTKMTFANDKMAFEGVGKLVDDDGWKVNTLGAGEIKQAKKEWKLTGQLDIQSPDMGGAKAAAIVSKTSVYFCPDLLTCVRADLLTKFYLMNYRQELSTTTRVKPL